MKLVYYGNSFVEIVLDNGKRIVCDPWILDGAYYGSWHHYPPLEIPEQFYVGVDYIYLSHLHPDHFDKRSVKLFDKQTPVIISERSNGVLKKNIFDLGFANIKEFPIDLQHELDGFKIQLWNDFLGYRFDNIDFALDSSIAIIADGQVLLNINDNILEPKDAEKIHTQYPNIDCALLPYAGAGPYPQLFDNLNEADKIEARDKVKARYLTNFIETAKIISAKSTVPCAGEYVIGGKNWSYTQYLHTPTPSEVRSQWELAGLPSESLEIMQSHDVLDLTHNSSTSSKNQNSSYSHQDRVDYAKSKAGFPLLIDDFKIPDGLRVSPQTLNSIINKANNSLLNAQSRFSCFPKVLLILEITGVGSYSRDLGSNSTFKQIPENANQLPYLQVTLSYEYLFAVMTQHVHWNNLEIGNHVRICREPNIYEADAHLLLSFFHF